MKNIIILALGLCFLSACTPQKYQDQRCYGLLVDSLTNLSKLRDRVADLEGGSNNLADEYEMTIETMQQTIDSLKAARRPMYLRHKTKQKNKNKAVISKAKDNKARHFYYENNKQKYYFYDHSNNKYYSVDHVTGEKVYL